MSFIRRHFQDFCALLGLVLVLFVGARLARGYFDTKQASLMAKYSQTHREQTRSPMGVLVKSSATKVEPAP